MTFEQFYKTLLKQWSIVIACLVLAAVGAYLGSARLIKPQYQSTTVMEVVVRTGGSPLMSDNVQASQNLAETEANLVTTHLVLAPVAAQYPGMTEADLAKEVTATATANTQLLQINVLDPDPAQAANLANSIAASLIKQQTLLIQPAPTDGSFLVVADAAQPATAPAKPNKLVNTAAGAVIGLLLGMVLALLLEWLDTRVRSGEEVSELTGKPVLGAIWREKSEKALSIVDGYSANTDEYGVLRANIGFVSKEKAPQIFVVTSAVPGEGKSVIAANLAVSMARSGKKTLLIDANLRQPTVYKTFAIAPHVKGFSNAVLALRLLGSANAQLVLARAPHDELPGAVSLAPYVHTVNVPNLAVMPSGPLPPGPVELLGSDAMQHFFSALRHSGTDVVIFDTAALLGLPDAEILASKADATLVVVDMTNARKKSLKQVKALLDQAGARVLGYVLNKQHQGHQRSPYRTVVQVHSQTTVVWHQKESENKEEESLAGTFVKPAQGEKDGKKELSASETRAAIAAQETVEVKDQQLLKQKRER